MLFNRIPFYKTRNENISFDFHVWRCGGFCIYFRIQAVSFSTEIHYKRRFQAIKPNTDARSAVRVALLIIFQSILIIGYHRNEVKDGSRATAMLTATIIIFTLTDEILIASCAQTRGGNHFRTTKVSPWKHS